MNYMPLHSTIAMNDTSWFVEATWLVLLIVVVAPLWAFNGNAEKNNRPVS